MKKFFICLFVCVLCLVFVGCGQQEKKDVVNGGDDIFSLKESAHYVYTDNLDQMLSRGNHTIIKCKVVSKSEPRVIDNFGKMTDADLYSESQKNEAIANIKTPYQLYVQEVFLGENVKVGEKITFNARYGYIEKAKASYSVENYPELEVGKEYILFLSSMVIDDKLVYYFSFPPANAIEINLEKNTFVCVDEIGESVFDEYDSNFKLLIDDLKNHISENKYESEPDYLKSSRK